MAKDKAKTEIQETPEEEMLFTSLRASSWKNLPARKKLKNL